MSLRRWTDDGRLSCYRVGKKRERRFRDEDLLAFLERQGARSSPAGHTCVLYDSDVGRLRLAVPLLADGVRQGHLCLLIATPEGGSAICDALPRDIPRDRIRVSDGAPSAQAAFEYLERTLYEAVSQGVRVIRLVGDMAWCLRQRLSVKEILELESAVDQSLPRRFPLVALCQYDVREFSGMATLGALRVHRDNLLQHLSQSLA